MASNHINPPSQVLPKPTIDREGPSVETFLFQRYFIVLLHKRTRITKEGRKAIFKSAPTNAVACADVRAITDLNGSITVSDSTCGQSTTQHTPKIQDRRGGAKQQ
jgi:hypothetical protein